MNTDTKKLVWRRQFDKVAKVKPEWVDRETCTVKYPLPSTAFRNYQTLTTHVFYPHLESNGTLK